MHVLPGSILIVRTLTDELATANRFKPQFPVAEYAVVQGEDMGAMELAVVHVPTRITVWSCPPLDSALATAVALGVCALVEMDTLAEQTFGSSVA